MERNSFFETTERMKVASETLGRLSSLLEDSKVILSCCKIMPKKSIETMCDIIGACCSSINLFMDTDKEFDLNVRKELDRKGRVIPKFAVEPHKDKPIKIPETPEERAHDVGSLTMREYCNQYLNRSCANCKHHYSKSGKVKDCDKPCFENMACWEEYTDNKE